MRAINVFLSILVSFAMGLFVFEGGLRILGFGPPHTINRFDPVLGWSKKPGSTAHRKTDEFDVSYEINALGLRDDPVTSPKKPDGTFRVVMLGDSFVLGYTVDRHDLFVDQLEGLWQSEGRRVDVINTGTEGYSTDQEVAWFLQNGEAFEPDLVMIFPYENDLYWSGQPAYLRKDKPRFDADGKLEARTLVDADGKDWRQKWALTRWLAPKPYEQHYWPHPSGQQLYKEYAPLLVDAPDFMQDTLARTEGALMALREECQRLGAALVLAPIPSKESFYAELREAKQQKYFGKIPPAAWDPDKPSETYLELARKLKIKTIDPREGLRRAVADADGPLYYAQDIHLNARGNLAFAHILAEGVDQLGLFPAGHTRQTAGTWPTASTEEAGGIARRWQVFGALLVLLSALYIGTYRDEPAWQAPLKVGGMLAMIFTIFFGLKWLIGVLPMQYAKIVPVVFVVGVLGFVVYKMGRKIGTIAELTRAFVMRGHWYLMPLVVVLLTIGSLLVVAASSPFVAPFIYTLF